MAKVKAPLFSFSASGKLADALVYFPWKGIQSVREYVMPANPKTEPQKAQRALMTAAVAEWHGAAYTTLDRSAWRVYSGVLVKIMAGFNAMVREHIKEAIKGNTWERIHNARTALVLANSFDILVTKAEGGNVPTIHWGVSKLYMPNSQGIGADGVDEWRTTIAGLIANTGYFFYLDVGTSPTDYGRTGIYYQRTTA